MSTATAAATVPRLVGNRQSYPAKNQIPFCNPVSDARLQARN